MWYLTDFVHRAQVAYIKWRLRRLGQARPRVNPLLPTSPFRQPTNR
jgi:hypothetical protein